MALQVVAQIVATLVGVPGGDPTDVEADATAAPMGVVNVQIPRVAGNSGFLTLEPIAAAIEAALVNGPCTVTVSQGAGNLAVTTTA